MAKDRTLEILKQALLLEKRSNSFYQTVAQQTNNKAVKSFFELMADEEQTHIQMLSAQYKSYQQKGRFDANISGDEKSRVAELVLSKNMKEQVSAAGYEAAAISAAISMEMNSVKLYTERAESATDNEEKLLYEWLASWEETHLDMLHKIDDELTESVWYDNQFWPF